MLIILFIFHSYQFDGLKQLTELYLDNNRLRHIDANAFKTNRDLKVIHLQHNLLTFEEFRYKASPFQYLHEIRKLFLSHNLLSNFLVDWELNTEYLEELDLSYNKFSSIDLTEISDDWHNIAVELSHNNIATIIVDNQISTRATFKSRWILGENPLNCDCRVLNLVKFVRGEFGNTEESDIIYDTNNLNCVEPEQLRGVPVKSISPQDLLCPIADCSLETKCSCWYRPNDMSAIVDCSNANLSSYPNIRQLGDELENIELNLTNNKITKLPSTLTGGYKEITHLYLANNSIKSFDATNLSTKLIEIDLSNNKLAEVDISMKSYFEKMPNLKANISGNPWKCDCNLQNFIYGNARRITDSLNVECDGEIVLKRGNLCSGYSYILILVVSAIALIVGMGLGLFYKYQKKIKIWLFHRGWCLWCCPPEDMIWQYDAFISYSHLDKDFVNDQLVPQLESEEHQFKLCIHDRDWIAGDFILTQVRNQSPPLMVVYPLFE